MKKSLVGLLLCGVLAISSCGSPILQVRPILVTPLLRLRLGLKGMRVVVIRPKTGRKPVNLSEKCTKTLKTQESLSLLIV